MADRNAIVLRDLEPPATDARWRGAPEAVRLRFYRFAADRAVSLKRAELRKGVGVDGQPLMPVKPRRDGATGKPLDPHYGESRSVKWLRASIGLKAHTITLYWSHGFGRILGYHARGEVIGAYLRNVIGLTKTDLARLKADVRAYWRRLKGGGSEPRRPRTPSPKPRTPALPVRERRIAARYPGMAEYLQGPPEPPRPRADLLRKAKGAPAFTPTANAKAAREPTVAVSVAALEAGWRKDAGFHVPPGGGADQQKYRNALAFVKKATREGTPIEQPRITVDADGTVSFTDGRHRFAALRDLGHRTAAVSVDRAQAARARKLIGVKSRKAK